MSDISRMAALELCERYVNSGTDDEILLLAIKSLDPSIDTEALRNVVIQQWLLENKERAAQLNVTL